MGQRHGATFGAFGVDPNFATPYMQNYNLNIQRTIAKGVLQVGYVGSTGRKLVQTRNWNAALPGVGTVQQRRPYAQRFPTLAAINMLETASNSNYNSLQIQYTQNNWKGLTGSFAYSYSKALDWTSEPRNSGFSNPYNTRLDWGPSDFDRRHIVNAFFSYSLPKFTDSAKWLTQGWQLNTLVTAISGSPINFRAGVDLNQDGDTLDRTFIVSRNVVPTLTGGTNPTNRRWVQTADFLNPTPAQGLIGNLARNTFYGPSLITVDPSLFKEFPVYKERVRAQLRIEMFNLFNRANFANPTITRNAGTFGLITNTLNGGGAPGLGVGEPRNMQFALKFLW